MEQQNNKKPEGNIHPDNSVLSRDSQLYRPEDTRTTREKLKSMKFTRSSLSCSITDSRFWQ